MAAGFDEIDEDLNEVIRLMSAKAKDAEKLRRARERADKICEEMKTKYGKVNVAVELINETRNSR